MHQQDRTDVILESSAFNQIKNLHMHDNVYLGLANLLLEPQILSMQVCGICIKVVTNGHAEKTEISFFPSFIHVMSLFLKNASMAPLKFTTCMTKVETREFCV